MSKRTTTVHIASAVLLCASMAVGTLASAAESISSILSSPLVMYVAPDSSAERRHIDIPKGPAPAGWQILETKPPFYRIEAGEHGEGWVSRSAIIKGAQSSGHTGCGNTYAGQQAQVTGGVSGMGNCKK